MNDKIENSKIPNLKSKEELFNLLNELKNEINGNKKNQEILVFFSIRMLLRHQLLLVRRKL